MAEYGTLLQDLTNNITLEDLEQLKSACKEDIPSEKSEEITTGSAWFSFLESHNKLDKGGGGDTGILPPAPHVAQFMQQAEIRPHAQSARLSDKAGYEECSRRGGWL